MISIREQALGQQIEKEAEHYMKRYKSQIELLESQSLVAKVRSITAHDAYSLGKMLESFEIYRDLCEEDGTLSQLGKIPDVAFDVITVAYGTSPISAVAAVQPVPEEKGTVYYKKLIAQTARAGVNIGDEFFNATNATDGVPPGYASERITGEVIEAATTDAVLDYGSTLVALPLRPYTVEVTATTSGAPVTASDNGNGLLVGYDLQGTIDYVSGAIVVQYKENPGAGQTITCDYSQDLEAAADIPKVIMKLDTKQVNCRVYALKDTIGLEQSYALRRRFGMIAEDEIATDLISSINSELMNTLVGLASANAVGNYNWSRAPLTGTSFYEHKQSFKDALAEAESNMLGNAGRGTINCMLAGRNACAIISTLPGWVKISDGTTIGPHIYGTLDGVVVVRIPSNAVLNANEVICIYKGLSPFEAALVYCPYMPLVVTTALPTGANPLVNQKAAATWAAIETLVPQFMTKITITA